MTARSSQRARLANLVLGATLALVTVLGFAHALGFLGINGLADPDNFLHLVTATLSLYFASGAADTEIAADSSDAIGVDEPSWV